MAEAKRLGYRSRAAFKLIQLDEKFKFLGRGKTIVDLGCAPGGWTQIAVLRNKGSGQVVGLDILPTEPIPGAVLIQQDFTAADAADKLKRLLDGKADIVMSDMAANTIGHQQTDHLRTMALVELAYDFAKDVLAEGGSEKEFPQSVALQTGRQPQGFAGRISGGRRFPRRHGRNEE